jgi:hypothetical protein
MWNTKKNTDLGELVCESWHMTDHIVGAQLTHAELRTMNQVCTMDYAFLLSVQEDTVIKDFMLCASIAGVVKHCNIASKMTTSY